MNERKRTDNREKKIKRRRGWRYTITLTVCIILSISLSLPAFASVTKIKEHYDREYYVEYYISKGFPSDYAQRLAELKLAHPAWSFEPLFISELNSTYTFSYIVERQTKDPQTNLVYSSEKYSAFFDKSLGASFDSGWYSASDDAVRYFLDVRNFLNERDIFQFEDLKYYQRDYRDGVSGVLFGTFMENMLLGGGVSLDDYILNIGKTLGVSPVHIAARMRQEQGVLGNSAIISGKCGDTLYSYYKSGIYRLEDGTLVAAPSGGHTKDELLSYNGYYNYFNLGASGTGLFDIYLGAMKRAKTGTKEMESVWGGASWDTPEKSIYGGVYYLKKTYIDDYQNTLYLQKFNIDPRSSRNFWGQYMQNVAAALSEGRKAYESYLQCKALESEFVFSIPVFEGMPDKISKDPSGGYSDYSSSDKMIKYHIRSDFPSGMNTTGKEVRTEMTVSVGDTVKLQGYSVHTRGGAHYEVSIDGGAFEKILSYARADVIEKYGQSFPLSKEVNGYLHHIDTRKLGSGKHTVCIRAKTLYGSYYEVAYITLNIEEDKVFVEHDINGDGVLDIYDLIALIDYMRAKNTEIFCSPDINGDGKVNNRDIISLIQKIAK